MQNDGFYADDVQAAAIADNNMDPDTLVEDDDTPVTSGEMEIGDMDTNDIVGRGSEDSYDEETVAGSDNVISDDIEIEE